MKINHLFYSIQKFLLYIFKEIQIPMKWSVLISVYDMSIQWKWQIMENCFPTKLNHADSVFTSAVNQY